MRIKNQQDARYVLLISCLPGAGIQFPVSLYRELHWKAIIFLFLSFSQIFQCFHNLLQHREAITRQAGTVTSKSLMDTPTIRLIA